MFTEEEKQRYSRHIILEGFGPEAQAKLKYARVLMVGAGGLGCPALLYLAAAGVGCIGIIDDDKVALSNLQRQVLFTLEDVGQYKAVAAAKRLAQLNDHITFQVFTERIDPENVLDIIKDYDLVIDGTDNFATRYLLNDACVLRNKPLVYGAIYKFTGQVSVFNYKDGPTYRCLFPELPRPGEMPGCGEIGVLGVLPGIIGTWQATEAIKIITGIGEPLSGKLLTFDLLSNEINSFRFEPVEANKQIKSLGTYTDSCQAPHNEIDGKTLKEWLSRSDVQLIDVREKNEYDTYHIGGKHIALSTLEQRMDEIDPARVTVVHCQSGIRSATAIGIIKNRFPHIRIYNLKEGLEEFR